MPTRFSAATNCSPRAHRTARFAHSATPSRPPRRGLVEPWLALLIFAGGIIPVAAFADAANQDDAPRLQNGCVPGAYLYLDSFRARHPDEDAKIMLLDIPDGSGGFYGHAVVVYREAGRLHLWDYEAGAVRLPAKASVDSPTFKSTVIRHYLGAIRELKLDLTPAKLRDFQARRKTGPAACAALRKAFASRRAAAVVYRNGDQCLREAVAFVGGGLVWVYMPDTGTAFTAAQPSQSYRSLVLTALQTHYPKAELLSLEAPAAD